MGVKSLSEFIREMTVWGGFWAPAGTPKKIVNKLSTELGKVILSDEYRKIMEESGKDAHANFPAEFAAFIKAERPKWARLIKTAGVKVEQ